MVLQEKVAIQGIILLCGDTMCGGVIFSHTLTYNIIQYHTTLHNAQRPFHTFNKYMHIVYPKIHFGQKDAHVLLI